MQPLDRNTCIIISLLVFCSYVSYTNGVLWPAAILTFVTAAAMIAALLVQKRHSRNNKEK
jgi:hypothetical protein